jgi:hypothetical protein
MKKLTTRVSEILLPFAVVFLLSSCANRGMAPEDVQQQAFDDFRAEIHEVISEPERAEKAIELTQRLADDVLHFSEKYAKRRTEVRKLNFDYDTPRAEFEALFATADAEMRENQRRARKTHRELLSIMTGEEWDTLSKARTSAISSVLKTINVI